VPPQIHYAAKAVLDSGRFGPRKHAPPDLSPGVAFFAIGLRIDYALRSGGFLFVIVDFGELRVDHVFLLFSG
jgi:hypothetical protein